MEDDLPGRREELRDAVYDLKTLWRKKKKLCRYFLKGLQKEPDAAGTANDDVCGREELDSLLIRGISA